MNDKDFYVLMFLIIAVVGGMLNLRAIVFNDGRMPVKDNYNWSADYHFSYIQDKEVKVPILTDWIAVPGAKISLGDILIFSGAIGELVIIIISIKELINKKSVYNELLR